MNRNAHDCQRELEILALLKILALGRQQIAAGRVVPLDDAVAHVKARRRVGSERGRHTRHPPGAEL